MIVLAQLLLAHLLGDFLLQPTSGVQQKEVKKWRSPFLYLHAVIHFGLIMLITWHTSMWLPAIIIAGTHLLIDGAKLQFQQEQTRTIWFIVDQALHLLVIVLVWLLMMEPEVEVSFPLDPDFWYVLTGAVFLSVPGSIIISLLLSPYSKFTGETSGDSLPNAGKYIGILERLMTFLFILLGQWAAIGFLMAAKSIFRFGDLTNAKDRKLTEYILIGTLLSFGLAIVTGLLVRLVI